jgi:S-methylmethionine-dependent homocysteine/selenocysteine methylase
MSSARTGFVETLGQARKSGRALVLDGATGTALDQQGVDTGTPLWSGMAPLDHPELLARIHAEHVAAGADILTSCTFRTTRRAFRAAGQADGLWKLAAAEAVRIAREMAADQALVAGSIAPLEDCWRADLAPSGPACRAEHALLASELVAAGVDVLWLETFGALGELVAAAEAAVEIGAAQGVPFAAALTTDEDGSLLTGEPLEEAALRLRELGAALIAINCVPARFVDRALPRLLESAGETPIGVYASLATAEPTQRWSGSNYVEPTDYAELAAQWLQHGLGLIGACCGSTAAHVAALRGLVE